ncbi:MAG: DUF362 domain-containing protein [Clostridia bacterium]
MPDCCDVSVVSCHDYTPSQCKAALIDVLNPFGGLDWVTPGMRIAIKANLVVSKGPDAAATTHPTLVAELCRMLTERGALVVVGDSPGGAYALPFLSIIYAATGMAEAERAGASLNRDFSQTSVELPDARIAKQAQFTSYLLKADAIIDFCKIKTHGMMALSGATKNMFGAVPGFLKPEYHMQYPNHADFADALVDIVHYLAPRLCIADAVVGMEGNGPTAGKPRHIGALLASHSPHALDLAAAHMLGLELEDVPTLIAAYRRGLIPDSYEKLNIAGELAKFIIPDFELIEMKDVTHFSDSGTLRDIIGRIFNHQPRVDKLICVGCGECAQICPAKAITISNSLPNIDRDKCIRCFCCQEFCRFGAMKVYRPVAARLLNK